MAPRHLTLIVPPPLLWYSFRYDVYVVAQDDMATPNLQTYPVKLDVTTGLDQTPPSYLTGYPTTSGVDDFAFAVDVQLDEEGDCWCVRLCVHVFAACGLT